MSISPSSARPSPSCTLLPLSVRSVPMHLHISGSCPAFPLSLHGPSRCHIQIQTVNPLVEECWPSVLKPHWVEYHCRHVIGVNKSWLIDPSKALMPDWLNPASLSIQSTSSELMFLPGKTFLSNKLFPKPLGGTTTRGRNAMLLFSPFPFVFNFLPVETFLSSLLL